MAAIAALRAPRVFDSRPGSGRGKPSLPEDPVAAAREARLRYSSDLSPGIERLRCGKTMRYRDRDGRPVRDEPTLARIKSLAIPPAWTDVWICPWPNGHIQATGRDAQGRKQYRYHTRWRMHRDSTKYERMAAFGRALGKIQAEDNSRHEGFRALKAEGAGFGRSTARSVADSGRQ